jgi:hypothetical protein
MSAPGDEDRGGRRDEEAVSPEEFIRSRPEQSPEQGAAAGPDSPETLEPTQGDRLPAAERSEDR